MPIWNPKYESMPRGDLAKLQEQRLRQIVTYAYERIPFYQQQFRQADIVPKKIKGLDDLRRIPFMTKQDMRDEYPFNNFAVPLQEVECIHASSGTTGKPTVGGYTRRDMQVWQEVMARAITSGGVTAVDVVHNALGYGLFTGGLGFHIGLHAVGATVIPASSGLTRRQIMLLEDFGATVLVCTPSYALILAEEAREQGIDFRQRMKVRVGLFGAEPWTAEMRHKIESQLGLDSYDNYGLTEIIGPGVAVECEQHNGLHINEDHFLPEIVDPDTGEPLPYGQEGELVFTTLTKEAMPMLRYRTRDLTVLYADPCPCERTTVRMEKVHGRTDDMLIVRGVNIFPSLIEKALLGIEGLEPHYQIVIDRPQDRLDKLEVWVEANHSFFAPVDTHNLDRLSDEVALELSQTVGVKVEVKLMGPQSIDRSLGKAKRIVDKRELYKG